MFASWVRFSGVVIRVAAIWNSNNWSNQHFAWPNPGWTKFHDEWMFYQFQQLQCLMIDPKVRLSLAAIGCNLNHNAHVFEFCMVVFLCGKLWIIVRWQSDSILNRCHFLSFDYRFDAISIVRVYTSTMFWVTLPFSCNRNLLDIVMWVKVFLHTRARLHSLPTLISGRKNWNKTQNSSENVHINNNNNNKKSTTLEIRTNFRRPHINKNMRVYNFLDNGNLVRFSFQLFRFERKTKYNHTWPRRVRGKNCESHLFSATRGCTLHTMAKTIEYQIYAKS